MSDIKNQIEEWFQTKTKQELQNIYKILATFEKEYDFEVIYPKTVIEDGNFREIVIGIKNMKEHDFEKVIIGLVEFYKIEELSYINIINIVDNHATFAFRIPISYFMNIKHFLETDEYEESEWGNPYPIIPTNELLSNLTEEVLIHNNIQNENVSILIQTLFDIWELIEYREKLNVNSRIEQDWLKELENKYSYKIKNKMSIVNIEDYNKLIDNILNKELIITKDNILVLLNGLVK